MLRSERRKRVEIAMQAVDLLDRADHYPRQLSGGQEQRVGIARAIVAHPKVVVADEPTGDLDPDSSTQILDLLKRLNQQLKVTLLMVTHDADAARIADRQFRLDHGKLSPRRSHCRLDTRPIDEFHPLRPENSLAAPLADDFDGQRFGGRVVCVLFCRRVRQGMNDLQRRQQQKRSLLTFQANKFCPATSHLPQDYELQIARLTASGR